MLLQQCQGFIRSMASCPILLKPCSSHANASKMETRNEEGLQHLSIAITIDCGCMPILVFKEIRTNNVLSRDGTPHCYLITVEWVLME